VGEWTISVLLLLLPRRVSVVVLVRWLRAFLGVDPSVFSIFLALFRFFANFCSGGSETVFRAVVCFGHVLLFCSGFDGVGGTD
jgi:hypothetical protein